MATTRRRGHGEGAIYERKVGGKVVGWIGMLDLGIQNGKRCRRAVTGKTKREVQDRLKTLAHDHSMGLVSADRVPTVAQWLTTWLETSSKPTVRPLTYRRYASIVEQHLIPGLGHHRLDKLTADQVQAFLNDRSAKLAPRTVHHLRTVLRTALGRAVKWGKVGRNVAALTDPPKVGGSIGKFLTPEEAHRLLDAAHGERSEALYTVALALGLRIGEALGLRWEDVDLDGRRLTVRFAMQRVSGRLQLVEPKTEKSRRTITLPPMAVEALRVHRGRQNKERLLAGRYWQETGLVFTSTVGSPSDASDVSRAFVAFLERSGLPRMRFHDLRHSCGSLLLAQGVPLKVIQEILGHSNLATTGNIYSHVLPSLFEDASEAMGRALGG